MRLTTGLIFRTVNGMLSAERSGFLESPSLYCTVRFHFSLHDMPRTALAVLPVPRAEIESYCPYRASTHRSLCVHFMSCDT